jgi:hypothetical protein
VSGPARVVGDRDEIRDRYSPLLRAWLGDLKDGRHDGGPDDPRICLIKVRAVAAQYAVSRKGLFGTAIELARGVKDGEVPSVNKLRILSKEEIEECEFVDCEGRVCADFLARESEFEVKGSSRMS